MKADQHWGVAPDFEKVGQARCPFEALAPQYGIKATSQTEDSKERPCFVRPSVADDPHTFLSVVPHAVKCSPAGAVSTEPVKLRAGKTAKPRVASLDARQSLRVPPLEQIRTEIISQLQALALQKEVAAGAIRMIDSVVINQ